MNTDELIEGIHAANAARRNGEHTPVKRKPRVDLVALPVAAAILLLLLIPRHSDTRPAATTNGIYCNSQCSPDEVMALIDNHIDHIKHLQDL